MGADCKSVGLCLPRFESWICHPNTEEALTHSGSGPPRMLRSASSSAGQERAAVDVKHLSGEVSPGRRHQVRHQRSDVVRRAGAEA